MVNDFKIKKYWITALCTVLFSLAGFSQGLSDATIGFNLSKETEVLKKQGLKDEDLTKEIARLRKIKMASFIIIKNKEAAAIQENKMKPLAKSILTKNIKTASKISSLAKTEMECSYDYYRAGRIQYAGGPTYDQNSVKINTPANITFYKYYNGTNGNLSYEWKLYNPDGIVIDTKNTSNFSITLPAVGAYKIVLTLTDAIGCSEFEATLYVRDSNNCVISPEERNGTIYTPRNSDQLVENRESIVTLSPSGFSTNNLIYKWDLFDVNGSNIFTSSEPEFKFTPPAKGQFLINLKITDPNGCSTTYTRNVETVDICTYTQYDDYFDIMAPEESAGGRVSFAKVGQRVTLEPVFFSGGNKEFTYSWKLFDPKGQQIGTGSHRVFPFTPTEPGYYTLTADLTNLETGCILTAKKTVASQIENGCVLTNPKSSEVYELYLKFVKKLIERVVLGETDEQINSSIAMPEFMALKPYIKNGVGDKIYNFVSIQEGYGDQRVNGINFSFSPEREYDIHIYSIDGVYYNSEYSTPEDLEYNISSAIFTNISQYIAADDFFVSCQVINGGKKAKTGKVVLEPYECTRESEVRNIIFCPGEGSHCTPEIVGTIKSNFPFIYPKTEYSFYFETIIPNLTYSWSITSETGEVLSTSDADITTPYRYTFLNEGIYFVKLTAKNELGCTTNFTKKIIVDNKRCANDSNNFTFETEENGVTYIWTTTDINGNIVDTITNTTGNYSFTTNTAGKYEVKLTANAEKKCETIFAKTIFVENCTPVVVVSCTQNNPLTPKIHQLFINLINKAATTPNGVDVNTYAKTEIAALAPYTFGPNAKIFNFSNDSSSVSFSFTENYTGIDVYIPKSSQGTITGIDLSKYESSSSKTIVEINYTNGSSNLTNGYVTNIDFCPSIDCTPITGVINIVKRGTASTNKKTNSSSKI